MTEKEIIRTLKLIDLYNIKDYKWLLSEHNMRNCPQSYLVWIKLANRKIDLIVDERIKKAIKLAKKAL